MQNLKSTKLSLNQWQYELVQKLDHLSHREAGGLGAEGLWACGSGVGVQGDGSLWAGGLRAGGLRSEGQELEVQVFIVQFLLDIFVCCKDLKDKIPVTTL